MEEYTMFLHWFRVTLSILAIIVALWLLVMTVRYWRTFEIGQKLWATGAILILIYVADANYESATRNIEFRWRLIPLILGLIAYFAYLLEPGNRKAVRFGRPTFGPR